MAGAFRRFAPLRPGYHMVTGASAAAPDPSGGIGRDRQVLALLATDQRYRLLDLELAGICSPARVTTVRLDGSTARMRATSW
jgi:hypothetical protein